MEISRLIELAAQASENSYSPYSGFTVGAALVTKSGRIYLGCNIENSAYGPTNCAERTAFFKAISEGEREFTKIVIVGGDRGDFSKYCYPCGVCRQVMAEFCNGDFEVILGKIDGEYRNYTLRELLPESFHLK